MTMRINKMSMISPAMVAAMNAIVIVVKGGFPVGGSVKVGVEGSVEEYVLGETIVAVELFGGEVVDDTPLVVGLGIGVLVGVGYTVGSSLADDEGPSVVHIETGASSIPRNLTSPT
jgi:hypothetical protein